VHAAGDIACAARRSRAKGVGADRGRGHRVYAEGNTSVARGARFVAAAGDKRRWRCHRSERGASPHALGRAFDASASNGRAGSILLDPNDLVVETDMLAQRRQCRSDGTSWNAGSLTLSADNSITIILTS